MTACLDGKTILVTGGSSGIGRATALALAGQGALVGISHHPNDNADAAEAVAEIERRGGKAFAISAFLGPAGSAESLSSAYLSEIEARAGEAVIDVLVNNVGGGWYGRVPDTTDDYFDEVMGRNLRVPFFLVKALLPAMRNGGCVINISSAAARLVNPDLQVYSLAKAAQNKFTQLLARELGPQGIRVNGVMPGFVDTAINRTFFAIEENLRSVIANTALGRIAQPEDIADVVLALSSPAFRFVTGQLVEVSGGFSM